MCKEVGVPRVAASPEARKAWGLAVWEDGDLFRPGKTRRKPGPDTSGDTKARRRLARRAASWDAARVRDMRRRGSTHHGAFQKRPGSLSK